MRLLLYIRGIHKLYFCNRLPKGFSMKVLSPDAAEYIATYWSPASIEYPMEHKVRFLKDVIATFEILGVYEDGNDQHPISWGGQKAGENM